MHGKQDISPQPSRDDGDDSISLTEKNIDYSPKEAFLSSRAIFSRRSLPQ